MDDARESASESAPEIPGFELLRLLGEGGMGQVHLARDLSLDRLVAIKTLSSRFSEEDDAYARFLREARVMATIEHPHVVQIHSLVDLPTGRAIVMQYVKGRSLSRRLIDDERIAPLDALRIALECSLALSAAWRHGIVHRDLKPSNLLLDEDERTLVADFGLAFRVRRSGRLSELDSDSFLCTPHYASPEQLEDAPDIDFRSDIYSLGLVLYEMLSGERPFKAPSPLEVVRRSLEEEAPRLEEACPDLPRELDELVARMSARDRDQRPPSLDALIEELGAQADLLASREASLALSPDWVPTPRVRSWPEPPAFVGRKHELRTMRLTFRETLDGAARVLLLSGEAGTGKSALTAAFARTIADDPSGALVLGTGCSPGAREPYGPFREALSLLVGDGGTHIGMGPFEAANAARIARSVPRNVKALVEKGLDLTDVFVSSVAVVQALRDLDAPQAWVSTVEKHLVTHARDLAEPLAQRGLFERYAELLQAIARDRPLVLVIDDLHWADEASIALLVYLSKHATESRILLIGCYRPSEVALGRKDARHPLGSALNEFLRSGSARMLPLDESGDLDFVSAIVDCSPNRLPDEFRRALFERTTGHPLFTIETLESLRASGALVRSEEGAWELGQKLEWDLMPTRVEATIRERIERLPDAERRLLRAAAVEGSTFSAEIAARLSNIDSHETVHLLSEELGRKHGLVVPQGVLTRAGHRVLAYRFAHVLFQRYLYESIDEVQRAMLHEEVGEALAERHEEATEKVASEIAFHFERASAPRRAIRYLREAGHEAMRVTAHSAAREFLDRALGLVEAFSPGDDRDRLELDLLLEKAAPVFASLGWSHEEGTRVTKRAVDLASASDDRKVDIEARILRILCLCIRMEAREGVRMGRETVDLARELGDSVCLIDAMGTLAFCLCYTGELEESLGIYEDLFASFDFEALAPLPTKSGPEAYTADLAWAGTLSWLTGDPRKAESYYETSLVAAERSRSLHTTLQAYFHYMLYNFMFNPLDVAEPVYEEAKSLAHRADLAFYDLVFLHFGGGVRAMEGDLQGGYEQLLEARRQAQALGSGTEPLHFPVALIEVTAALGRFDEALVYIEEILAMAERGGGVCYVPEYLRLKAGVLLARGREEDQALVEPAYREALELALSQCSAVFAQKAATEFARFLAARGSADEARAVLAPVIERFPGMRGTRYEQEASALLESL